MSAIPKYTPHQKVSLRKHPMLNEAWLHDRICDDPSIFRLSDVRVLDRERSFPGGTLNTMTIWTMNETVHARRLSDYPCAIPRCTTNKTTLAANQKIARTAAFSMGWIFAF